MIDDDPQCLECGAELDVELCDMGTDREWKITCNVCGKECMVMAESYVMWEVWEPGE